MVSLLLACIYLAFISLGLPDSLLGSVWPIVHQELQVPVSWSGYIFMTISAGTVISSLQSDRLTKRFGPGVITSISIALSAVSLLGFSFSHSFLSLCLWAVPYGLAAGSVDAALNNYVALHFKSRHMSWLHCMWGVGASTGPLIMSAALTHTHLWNNGYRITGLIQLTLGLVLFLSLPLWRSNAKAQEDQGENPGPTQPIPLREVIRIKGAKEIMLSFLCYCAMEQTVGLWASSYLVFARGVPEVTAARFASFFYIGITTGRAINGFLTFRLSDRALIHLGQGIVLGGILLLALPLSKELALTGFIAIGLGCAPIYPCIIHSTPAHFGKERSQAMVGVQMASAYIGTTIMPPAFGFLSRTIGISFLPFFLLLILFLQFFMYTRVVQITRR